MKLRRGLTFVAIIACLPFLSDMFMSDGPDRPRVPRLGTGPKSVSSLPARAQQFSANGGQARRMLEEADPVEMEFDGRALPDVIDELVRQTGIQVTADFAPAHDSTLVTMQMYAPPFVGLETVADQYGMELLETARGWWLRPGDQLRVCYQIHDMGADAGAPRVTRLVENLRKIVAGQDGVKTTEGSMGAQVTVDAEGVHVSGSRDAQNLSAVFLESVFHRPIKGRREDLADAP